MPTQIYAEAVACRGTAPGFATLDQSQATTTDWDVLVIGAGPSGTIVARRLALFGWRTLLVDKGEFPRSKVCGGCLNPGAVALLRSLDLGSTVSSDNAHPIDRFQLACGQVQVELPIPGGAAVDRATFDAQLVHAAIAAGVHFLPATQATVCERSPSARLHQVLLQTSGDDARTAGAQVVISADGLNQSSVRRYPKLRSTITPRSRIGLGASLHGDIGSVEPGTIRMVVHRTGYVGMVRTPGDSLTVAAAIDGETLRDTPPGEAIARILQNSSMTPALQTAVLEADWRGTGPLTRSCRVVAEDDLLLLGDAAGYVEPFTGEGMAWGMQTAVALADCVSDSLRSREASRSVQLDSKTSRQAAAMLARRWNAIYGSLVASAQMRCRFLARALRHPIAVRGALRVLRMMPGLAQPLIRRLLDAPPVPPATLRRDQTPPIICVDRDQSPPRSC